MKSLPDGRVDMSIYSPPFCGLYNYSSSERDMSNCSSYQEFFVHYTYCVEQISRLTKPGRITAVHCCDVPGKGNGDTARMGVGANVGSGKIDFPGDIIRLHERFDFHYCGRRSIWNEPLGVRNRTMAKGLAHAQIVEDSTLCDIADAAFLLMFRKNGENKKPVEHPTGFSTYAGSGTVPRELQQWRGHTGNQIENKHSHWIWRQYASCFWTDIRGCDGTEPKDNSIREKGTLPFDIARDANDEKHPHPLQLDIIERACVLWSNPGEVVLTPFMGIGSEAYGAVINNRKAIGIELKPSYYKQAVLNMAEAETHCEQELISV
jgi:hypothetical protein